MKAAFIYSDDFATVSYGADHPMRPMRLAMTYDLIREKGLLDEGETLIAARQATDDEVLAFHSAEYVEALKEADSGTPPADAVRFGLGYGDCPSFKGVWEWSLYSAGASVQAAELVTSGGYDAAFNIAGGLHHAMAAKASGFCYINDAAVAIKYLLTLGKRVVYIDIDAHHGDGVEAAFYDTDQVLTISIHEDGNHLFPGTGFLNDTGAGDGRGYAVNMPLPPGAGDDLFVRAFEGVVPAFIEAYRPDVIVTQLGVDTFKTDPITHLQLTTNGFEKMVRGLKDLGLPWVALGGGGYDLDNVKRAWTLAWAVISGRGGDDVLGDIRDEPHASDDDALPPDVAGEYEDVVDEGISYLARKVLPLVKAPL